MATLERQFAQSAINDASIWLTDQEWAKADTKLKLERSMMHLERDLRDLADNLDDKFDAEECKRILTEIVTKTTDEKILAETILQEVESEIVDWTTTSDELKNTILNHKLWSYRKRFTEKQWLYKYPCFDMKACEGFLSSMVLGE